LGHKKIENRGGSLPSSENNSKKIWFSGFISPKKLFFGRNEAAGKEKPFCYGAKTFWA
jgi:hypothetical protein